MTNKHEITVKELIEKLSALDPNAVIVRPLECDEAGLYGYESFDPVDPVEGVYVEKNDGVLNNWFFEDTEVDGARSAVCLY